MPKEKKENPKKKPLSGKKGQGERSKMKISKWLEFEQTPCNRKTQLWNVISKKHGDYLGSIKWFGRWRQYAFFPLPETIWNPECLKDICEFIGDLMNDWKKGILKK